MSKMSNKERNDLPTDIFGLKEERKYPLTDEEHVLKAVQYFRFCDKKRRSELAKNINSQAKQFNMQLKVNRDNPFYQYADRKILTESYHADSMEEGLYNVFKHIREIEANVGFYLDREINYFFDTASPEALFDLEQNLVAHMSNDIFIKKYLEGSREDRIFNPYTEINQLMTKVYDIFFKFAGYYYGGGMMKNTRIFYSMVQDILFLLKRLTNGEIHLLDKYIGMLRDIISSYNCNKFMVVRCLLEAQHYYTVSVLNSTDEPENNEIKRGILDKITSFINECKTSFPQTRITIYTSHPLNDTLFVDNLNFINMSETLKIMNQEVKNDIHNMILNRSLNFVSSMDINQTYRFLGSINGIEDARFLNVLSTTDRYLRPENLRMIYRTWSSKLSPQNIMLFSELKLGTLFTGHDCYGNNIYFCIKDDSLYLVVSDIEKEDRLYIILLYRECAEKYHLVTNLTCSPEYFDKSIKAKYVMYEGTPSNSNGTMELLTEGISFDKEGGIKFSFKPRKSFMDEYAENHKLLLANHKSGNYEAMKTNLAFLFALINKIERDVTHNKKSVPEDVRKDAQKARAFAINDFKTYLKEVQKNEPNFNFTSYYESSDYGKLTINFTNDEVVGLKRLFRTIMFS